MSGRLGSGEKRIGGLQVIVIGLDGATFKLVKPWSEQGELPTFQTIMAEGCWGNLTSSIPTSTAPAWTCFATGKNPGKHGIFEFMRLARDKYDFYASNGNDVKAMPLWDILSEAGKKVASLNDPMSYPPHEVNGVMISGMLTPSSELGHCTYPKNLIDEINRVVEDYHIMPRGSYSKERASEYLEELNRSFDIKAKVALYLLRKEHWDLFIQVFNETDMVQHAFWHTLDPDHPRYNSAEAAQFGEAVLGLYKRVDEFLSRVLSEMSDDAVLFIVSDHGAGPLCKLIHNNTWLMANGFLVMKSTPLSWLKFALFQRGITPLNLYQMINRTSLGRLKDKVRFTRKGYRAISKGFFSFSDIDWSKSKAYAAGGGTSGLIYLNRKGREPRGTVEPGMDYEQVRDQIIAALRNLRDPATGDQVIGKIYKNEEIFSGEYSSLGPDIVYFPADPKYIAFSNFSFASNHIIEEARPHVSGQHRMEGILMIKGRCIGRGKRINGANILDVAPTILYLLDLPVSAYMDGKVLEGVLQEGTLGLRPVTYTDSTYQRGLSSRAEYTVEQEAEIRDRLRGLGYID